MHACCHIHRAHSALQCWLSTPAAPDWRSPSLGRVASTVRCFLRRLSECGGGAGWPLEGDASTCSAMVQHRTHSATTFNAIRSKSIIIIYFVASTGVVADDEFYMHACAFINVTACCGRITLNAARDIPNYFCVV